MGSPTEPPAEWQDLPPLRWGMVGAGRIAGKLADALRVAPGRVVAVTARDQARVQRFADDHDIPRAHTSLPGLLADDEVDAVYVATPHSHHEGPVIAALRSGRPVLCEKPLTYGLRSARRCIEAADATGQLLMEAMWTRFLPAHRTAAGWIARGDIGEVRAVRAGMGFAADHAPTGRLMAPELAGGALLDIGVYPLALTRWAFPQQVLRDLQVVSTPMPTGVDGQDGILLAFEGGGIAELTASLISEIDDMAWLAGTIGGIRLPTFHKAEQATLVVGGQPVTTATHPHLVNGLEHQVAAFTEAVADTAGQQGRREHPLMPLDDTLAVATWSQQIRDRIGLRFPFEDDTDRSAP